MEIIQVFKRSFDYLENNVSDAIHDELLGAFTDHDGHTAYGHACIFIKKLDPMKLSLEYNGKVYPYLYIKKVIANK